jgi:hypothetical protein
MMNRFLLDILPTRERVDAFVGAVAVAPANVGQPYTETTLAWLCPALRCITLLLGALHATVAILRQSMNEDGINYLDIGTAFTNGDWQNAVNGTWSPLYAWLIGAVVHVTQPSPRWEFPVVQIINFVVFVATLVCFEFFWRQLTRRYYEGDAASKPVSRMPRPLWMLLGYSLFVWSSLNLIEIWTVTPDMVVAACVYLAAALLVQSTTRDAGRFTWLALGFVLGIGYLAKAALFPLGIAALVVAAFVKGSPRAAANRLALSTLPFVMVAGPLVVALSLKSGHLTFGDVGRFTYIKHVNQLLYPHWGESLGRVNGRPEHPPRRVFQNPDIYEFAAPIGGTYPLAFDPGYWTAGLSPRFDLRQQVQALISNVRFYFDLFFRIQGGFVALLSILSIIAVWSGRRPASLSAETALVIWAICAFGLYAAVFVTARYIAVFVVVFWSGILAALTLPDGGLYRRLLTTCGAVLALFVWVNIAAVNVEAAALLLGYSVNLPADPMPAGATGQFSDGTSAKAPEIADALQQLGLRAGDRIGFIGSSYTAFWARLLGVRIVAEIPPNDAEQFWTADANRKAEVIEAFGGAGVTALVSEPVGRSISVPPGWQQIGHTGYLLWLFR